MNALPHQLISVCAALGPVVNLWAAAVATVTLALAVCQGGDFPNRRNRP